MYYISTESVIDSFKALERHTFNNESILHIFFILKSCGFNELEPNPVSNIKIDGLRSGRALGSLFGDNEAKPEKYNFINPFKLSSWSSQPTESLDKWVALRIGNNVAGGARTWRKIIDYNPDKETIKFTYNYLKNLKELTIGQDKIDLQGFSVWSCRFHEFTDIKPSKHDLIRITKDLYKLSDTEMVQLFENSTDIHLTYHEHPFDASAIRRMVIPDGYGDEWINSEKAFNDNKEGVPTMSVSDIQKVKKVETDKIKQALDRFSNVMLSGPPATSKSHFAKIIGDTYDKTVSVQFHPEYSYQDFIGGYFVNGDAVSFENGVLTNLCSEAKENPNKRYLLVIDEINRGNLGSILGETIQCLDRNYTAKVKIGSNEFDLSIPANLHILATRNTTDKSLSNIDLAIYRRFIDFKIMPDAEILSDLVVIDNGNISARDLLNRINRNLLQVTEDDDMQIGHALFLNSSLKGDDDRYYWSYSDFETLFAYNILPLAKEYCNDNNEAFMQVFGSSLLASIGTDEFVKTVNDYILID